jgi:hypothetical protein
MEVNSADTLEYCTPIFCPGNGGNTFVRNFDKELQDYTASYIRRPYHLLFKFILSSIANMFHYYYYFFFFFFFFTSIQPELVETSWPSHVKLQRLVLHSSVFNNQHMHDFTTDFQSPASLAIPSVTDPDVLDSDTGIFSRRSVSVNMPDWYLIFIPDNSEILSTSCASKLYVSYGVNEARQFKIYFLCFVVYDMIWHFCCRSQWPRGLRRRSAAARQLRSWVRNPTGGMDVCLLWVLCVVRYRSGLCDELITRPEEYYRLWCVVVCDLETSWMRRPWPTGGCRAKKKQRCIC